MLEVLILNDKNLIPTNKRSKSEVRKNASKGGIKSGETRRQRKTQREQLEMLLSLPLKNPKAVEQIKNLGIEDTEINNQMAMNVAMFNLILKGGKGAVQAYNSINDLIGDNEKRKLELEKAKEEIARLKLEQEKLKRELGNGSEDFEDLTPLAELLRKEDK